MSEQDHTALSGFNILKNVILPIKDEEQRYGDDTFKFFQDNNLDTAELVGIDKDENAGFINLDDNTNLETKDKFGFAKDVVTFFHDLPSQARYRLVLGAFNASRLATNLIPFATGTVLKPDSAAQKFISSNFQDLDAYINKQMTAFEQGYQQMFELSEGRKPNTGADLLAFIAQDYPYAQPVYKMLDKTGLPKVVTIPLAFGLTSGIAFDPKREPTTIFFDSPSIQGLKKFFNALPGTPEGEIFDRLYQTFEGTAFSKFIPQIAKVSTFLKRNIPDFEIQGAATSVGGATAIDEFLNNTINPVDNQNIEMQNQEPTILDNVKSGIDQFGNKLSEIGGAIKKEFSGDAQAAGPVVAKALTPVFKSTVAEAVSKIPAKAPGDQILGTLKNIPGVTQSEMKWIGLDDFLKGKPSVTKQEVSDFIQANRLDVNEVMLPRDPGKVTKRTDEELLQWFRNQNDSIGDDAYYAYINVQDALAENLGQRYDLIPYNKTKIGFLQSAEFQYNTQRFIDDAGLYEEFFRTGEILNFRYFKKNLQNQYYIGDISYAKTNKSLSNEETENVIRNFLRETDNLRRNHLDEVDYDNLEELLLSTEDFETLKQYLKDNKLKMAGEQKVYLDDKNLKIFHNEYVIRLNEDNLINRYEFSLRDIEDAAGGMVRTKYDRYTMPGGKDYKELIFTLSKGGENVGNKFPLQQGVTTKQTSGKLGIDTSVHMQIPGEFAHVRFKERDIAGRKTLVVEELQSDIFQQVKKANKEIFKNAKGKAAERITRDQEQLGSFQNVTEQDILQAAKAEIDDRTIKDFPFKNNWYELVTRRLIRYAADNNFSAIAIPEGRIAAARYGQKGGFVDNIEVNVKTSFIIDGVAMTRTREELKKNYGMSDKVIDNLIPNYYFTFKTKKGNKVIEEFSYQDGDVYNVQNQFPKSFGKFGGDLESVLLHRYTPEELKKQTFKYEFDKPEFTGEGRGKFELYDQAIPTYMKKYAKKWNAPVTKETLNLGGIPEDINFVVLKLTPEMKKSVQEKSQPLFNVVLPALIGGGAGKGISDNIQNNIISDPTKN